MCSFNYIGFNFSTRIDAPELSTPKAKLYANDFDQMSLKCQVKSNPAALITWYFQSKEIYSNYKYNLTLSQYKQIDYTDFSDLSNVQMFESILTINSLTQYDYGEYMCRAGNQIGISSKIIRLNRKSKSILFKTLLLNETFLSKFKNRKT